MNTVLREVTPACVRVPDQGPVLGRYELLTRAASGGMATVWAARLRGSRGFQKVVAVKTILPMLCADSRYERMFLDEAAVASRIHHPNVAQILDVGDDNGVLYLAMEWVDGVTVDELLRQARASGIAIPLPVAIRIAIQVASGLHAAHELRDDEGALVGLVHGDVSPQNIIVSFDGVTKLVDFGVAKMTDVARENESQTQNHRIWGKPAYLAPEQINGGVVDRRADIFALGLILHLLTTGTHPFQGSSSTATLCRIGGPYVVTPPSELVSDYPRELEVTLLQCLAKEPEGRFTTSDELVWALESSIPSELRATDQDVAVFVRAVAGDVRVRRWGALIVDRDAPGRGDTPPDDAHAEDTRVDITAPGRRVAGTCKKTRRREIQRSILVALVGGLVAVAGSGSRVGAMADEALAASVGNPDAPRAPERVTAGTQASLLGVRRTAEAAPPRPTDKQRQHAPHKAPARSADRRGRAIGGTGPRP